jgi:hypothetical protein
MEAIARRAVFALFFVNPQDEIRSILASMATDLSAGNISGFMSSIAKDFPARDEQRQQLQGLVSAFDSNSSVEIQTASGTADKQTAKVDWYLALRSRTDNAISVQRREVLSIEFTRRNKRWLITALDPPSFFTA